MRGSHDRRITEDTIIGKGRNSLPRKGGEGKIHKIINGDQWLLQFSKNTGEVGRSRMDVDQRTEGQ